MEPDIEVSSMREANAEVMKRWLRYIDNRDGNEIPEAARKFIHKKLEGSRMSVNLHESNKDKFVQVDERFSGRTGGGLEWKIQFRMDVDVPPLDSGTRNHFGYTIQMEPVRGNSVKFNRHIFLREAPKYGRPKGQESLNDIPSGKDHQDFQQLGSADWLCIGYKVWK